MGDREYYYKGVMKEIQEVLAREKESYHLSDAEAVFVLEAVKSDMVNRFNGYMN